MVPVIVSNNGQYYPIFVNPLSLDALEIAICQDAL